MDDINLQGVNVLVIDDDPNLCYMGRTAVRPSTSYAAGPRGCQVSCQPPLCGIIRPCTNIL
jgi:hypothetical protein